jgi:hypothetical protein
MFLCGNCSDVVVLRRINDQMMIGDAILVGMVPIYLLCLLLELSLEVLKEVRVEVLATALSISFALHVRGFDFSYPRWVSPAVALTVKTPPWMWRRETSKVPPPRS